ncbi:hypothetical protein Tco_1156451 [Tanacetum coccineum]
MSSFNHYGCSFCGGPHNGGNCPGCSVIESGNGFVYDQNPYPYHETNDYFNQPPQHQYETYSCEFCGGNSHPGFDCQTGNTPVFDQGPCYNQDFGFNQPPHYSPSQPQQYPCCEICGNDAHYGYDCPPQVPFVYDQDPCYNQDYDEFPQTLPSFQQQILCCENCGGPHATFECQPMNQNFHDSGFDQFQPPQSPVIHQPPQEMSMEALHAREDLMKSIENFLKKFNRISFQKTPKVLMQAWDKFLEIKHAKSEDVQELLNKLVDDVRNVNEELAEYTNTPSWNLPNSSYDDDDDEESSIPLKDIIMSGLPPCVAITPDSPKTDSLIMVGKHLDTIPETESDEFIKSSVENLVQNLSESEDECECDVPDCDDSQTTNFSTYSNPLFDDSTSSDNESSHEEEIHEMSFITYSNPLFDLDEEINSSEFNPIHNEDPDSTPKNDRFDTESYLLESLLDQFEDSNPEGDIRLVERLLYDNSTPRPPEAFQANFDTIIDSFPTFPIPVEDSDSLREEIDIFPGTDDPIPPGIENDDFDSEDDDNSTSLPEFESFHVDYPDSGDSTIDVVEDIPVDAPNILPTHPSLHMDFDFIPSHNGLGSDLDVSSPSGDRNKIYDPGICIEVESTRFLATHFPVIDTFLPFSSENEDKVFNHGVLASKEKSPPSSSHRGFKASKLFHQKSPMLIHGDNTPNLGVRHLHFYPP